MFTSCAFEPVGTHRRKGGSPREVALISFPVAVEPHDSRGNLVIESTASCGILPVSPVTALTCINPEIELPSDILPEYCWWIISSGWYLYGCSGTPTELELLARMETMTGCSIVGERTLLRSGCSPAQKLRSWIVMQLGIAPHLVAFVLVVAIRMT